MLFDIRTRPEQLQKVLTVRELLVELREGVGFVADSAPGTLEAVCDAWDEFEQAIGSAQIPTPDAR